MSWLNIVWANRSDWTDRQKEDYYATDPRAISDLAKFVDIRWIVWENACWEWNLSKELEKLPNVIDVIKSDKIHRWTGMVLDFMNWEWKLNFSLKKAEVINNCDWIITNPPYKYWKKWIQKSLEYTPNVAVMMKLVFLESADRYEFFKKSGLKKVLVYSKRLWVYKDNMKTKNSWLVAYAWFVFERWYKWEPIIDWIL